MIIFLHILKLFYILEIHCFYLRLPGLICYFFFCIVSLFIFVFFPLLFTRFLQPHNPVLLNFSFLLSFFLFTVYIFCFLCFCNTPPRYPSRGIFRSGNFVFLYFIVHCYSALIFLGQLCVYCSLYILPLCFLLSHHLSLFPFFLLVSKSFSNHH